MTSSGNHKHTNGMSNEPVSGSASSNKSQIDNYVAISTENERCNDRMNTLEKQLNSLLDKENIQIRQLQDKIEKLEEQAQQHKTQIKILEDKVMNHQPQREEEDDHSVLLPITNLTGNTTTQIKPENVITCKTDRNFQKQERSTIVQSKSEVVNVEKLQLLNPKDNDGMSNSQVTQNSIRSNEERIDENKNKSEIFNNDNSSTTSKPGRNSNQSLAGRGNFLFTRWMDSRDTDFSLWANENYRRPLLSYIGKIYGQKNNIRRVLDPLRIEFNNSPELDQLYAVIKEFEKQPGAKESLREWQHQTRPNHRLDELNIIFEFNSACPSSLGDWKITPSYNSEEIISRKSIKAYFDMICRDGWVTADIGGYLNLNKEDIFGGNDYDSHNERVTFVNVNLNESTIKLADNRVDLITCLVTLHHVPDLERILSEFVRILRPGGYLILREHDCKNKRSFQAKYLNFVHAFMMIARVGEFANACASHTTQKQNKSDEDSKSDTTDWKQQKSNIINYTNSIQYRTRDEWQQQLESVGFRLKVTLEYDSKINNPQALYYAVYQLRTK